MFNKIVNAAISNRLLVFLGVCVLVVMSSVVILKLNLDAFPDVSNVQLAIHTEAPGFAAVDVDQLITYPIEAVMSCVARCRSS